MLSHLQKLSYYSAMISIYFCCYQKQITIVLQWYGYAFNLFIFCHSIFPFPTLGESVLRKAHLANACKFDLLVSSDESKACFLHVHVVHVLSSGQFNAFAEEKTK